MKEGEREMVAEGGRVRDIIKITKFSDHYSTGAKPN